MVSRMSHYNSNQNHAVAVLNITFFTFFFDCLELKTIVPQKVGHGHLRI